MDFDGELDACHAEGFGGGAEFGRDPGYPRGVLDDPEEYDAFHWEFDTLDSVSDVEEDGERECCAGGPGYEENGVESCEVIVGIAVWAIDECHVTVRLLAPFPIFI